MEKRFGFGACRRMCSFCIDAVSRRTRLSKCTQRANHQWRGVVRCVSRAKYACMINRPDKIIVHHDGVSRKGPSFKIVDDYHKSREFPLSSLGFYCGYHYWIEKTGEIINARRLVEGGAHTIGQNFTSVGIGLAGNFDIEDPTPEQIAALGALLTVLLQTLGINEKSIFPHRKYANKSCYGSKLSDNWAAILYIDHEIARLQKVLAELS